jgi:hypothetical protein
MEITKIFELSRIEEIKILQNVRLIHRNDLNAIYSSDNLRVQFSISGELSGAITCFLCLDGKELEPADKNYLFPLFVESMNILIGRQISLDEELGQFKIKISSPKLNMNSIEINTNLKKSMMQKYDLEINGSVYTILTEYSLEALN